MNLLNLLKRKTKTEKDLAIAEKQMDELTKVLYDRNQKMIDEMRRVQNEDTQNR